MMFHLLTDVTGPIRQAKLKLSHSLISDLVQSDLVRKWEMLSTIALSVALFICDAELKQPANRFSSKLCAGT